MTTPVYTNRVCVGSLSDRQTEGPSQPGRARCSHADTEVICLPYWACICLALHRVTGWLPDTPSCCVLGKELGWRGTHINSGDERNLQMSCVLPGAKEAPLIQCCPLEKELHLPSFFFVLSQMTTRYEKGWVQHRWKARLNVRAAMEAADLPNL